MDHGRVQRQERFESRTPEARCARGRPGRSRTGDVLLWDSQNRAGAPLPLKYGAGEPGIVHYRILGPLPLPQWVQTDDGKVCSLAFGVPRQAGPVFENIPAYQLEAGKAEQKRRDAEAFTDSAQDPFALAIAGAAKTLTGDYPPAAFTYAVIQETAPLSGGRGELAMLGREARLAALENRALRPGPMMRSPLTIPVVARTEPLPRTGVTRVVSAGDGAVAAKPADGKGSGGSLPLTAMVSWPFGWRRKTATGEAPKPDGGTAPAGDATALQAQAKWTPQPVEYLADERTGLPIHDVSSNGNRRTARVLREVRDGEEWNPKDYDNFLFDSHLFFINAPKFAWVPQTEVVRSNSRLGFPTISVEPGQKLGTQQNADPTGGVRTEWPYYAAGGQTITFPDVDDLKIAHEIVVHHHGVLERARDRGLSVVDARRLFVETEAGMRFGIAWDGAVIPATAILTAGGSPLLNGRSLGELGDLHDALRRRASNLDDIVPAIGVRTNGGIVLAHSEAAYLGGEPAMNEGNITTIGKGSERMYGGRSLRVFRTISGLARIAAGNVNQTVPAKLLPPPSRR
jgi:hypothetical protein